MFLTKKKIVTIMFVFSGFLAPAAWAASTGQDAGSVLRDRADQEVKEKMEQTVQQAPKEEPVATVQPAGASEGAKVHITTVRVEDSTLIDEKEIAKVIGTYEDKDLDVEQIRHAVQDVTNLYRSKGFVTSRAYLPPQDIQSGLLIIKVMEGKLGEVTFKGNKYFSSRLLRSKIPLKEGEYFDYAKFVRSLEYINENSDLKVKANLVPGKKTGATDVVIEVQERCPYHIAIGYDNWAQKELGRYRYSMSLINNNVFGQSDSLYLSGLMSDGDNLRLYQGRYSLPLSNTLSIGFNALSTRTKLGGDFKDLNIHGRGDVYGVSATKEFIHTDKLQARADVAFDYKDIKDYALERLNSHDKLRVLRLGTEWDLSDKYGRNLLNPEVDFGIPHIMGGMAAKDDLASRTNSGGQFTKGVFSYYRLQPLPWDMDVLWKNNMQYTNNNLPSVEQFQIGGPASVRAYAPSERSGDNGIYTSPELSIPPYFLSKNLKVPFSQAKAYDALRFVVFYDYGRVSSHTPAAGDREVYNLRGWGVGFRFNPSNDTAFRLETGFPIGDDSTDGSTAHTWVEFQHQF